MHKESQDAIDIGNAIHTLLEAGYHVSSPDSNVHFELIDEAEGDIIQGKCDAKGDLGLGLFFNGYGACCSKDDCGQPVYIEKYDGQLIVRIYSDINSEEPTHSISLENARLDKRQEEEVV